MPSTWISQHRYILLLTSWLVLEALLGHYYRHALGYHDHNNIKVIPPLLWIPILHVNYWYTRYTSMCKLLHIIIKRAVKKCKKNCNFHYYIPLTVIVGSSTISAHYNYIYYRYGQLTHHIFDISCNGSEDTLFNCPFNAQVTTCPQYSYYGAAISCSGD